VKFGKQKNGAGPAIAENDPPPQAGAAPEDVSGGEIAGQNGDAAGKEAIAAALSRREQIAIASEEKRTKKNLYLAIGIGVTLLVVGAGVGLSFLLFGPSVQAGEVDLKPTELLKSKTQEAVLAQIDHPETAVWPGNAKWSFGRDNYHYSAASYVAYQGADDQKRTVAFRVTWSPDLEEIVYFKLGPDVLVEFRSAVDETEKPIEIPLDENGVALPTP
jgi:hypothetical protein